MHLFSRLWSSYDLHHSDSSTVRKQDDRGGLIRLLVRCLKAASDGLDPRSDAAPEWVRSGESYRMLPL
jgi:hypothetical protein